MKMLIGNKKDNSSLINVVFLIFVPTILLTVSYALLGHVQQTIPSLLLFYTLATVILFPIELAIVFYASKSNFGGYSLKSAFVNQVKTSWKKTLLYGFILFGFAGIVSVTIGPLEKWITTPIANKLTEIIPVYFDWNNMEYLRQY
ncbi:MAG: hypothetical protein AAGU32_17850, partial [Bacillota bacterium]